MTIEVKVIEKTAHPQVPSAVITTFQVYAPRFLLAEINTHRLLSRSAQSSRAVPVTRRIQMIKDDPFVPESFGKNKKGMSADENIDSVGDASARIWWNCSMQAALLSAEALAGLGVHKQQANRLIEPYAHFYGVITGTEWDNFWNLRISPAAQPEFCALATEMKRQYDTTMPRFARHHLPYREGYDSEPNAFDVSSARCARVSYKTFDGNVSLPEDDLRLCADLKKDGHLSPFDHPARADQICFRQVKVMRVQKAHWLMPEQHRQYWGWIPRRVDVERDLGLVCRRSSFDPIGDDNVVNAQNFI